MRDINLEMKKHEYARVALIVRASQKDRNAIQEEHHVKSSRSDNEEHHTKHDEGIGGVGRGKPQRPPARFLLLKKRTKTV